MPLPPLHTSGCSSKEQKNSLHFHNTIILLKKSNIDTILLPNIQSLSSPIVPVTFYVADLNIFVCIYLNYILYIDIQYIIQIQRYISRT